MRSPFRFPLLLRLLCRAFLLIATMFLMCENLHAAPVTTAISAGVWHSLFLRSDGTVWAAGTNNYGQLGLPPADKSTPVKVLLPVSFVPTPWQLAHFGEEATFGATRFPM